MDDPVKLCAYNQSVQRFLGLDIIAAEFSDASLKVWMLTLPSRLGAGLWIVPFRGIPESPVRCPLDLVYLDEDRRVVDVIESFPASRVSMSSQSAASVLVLPAHSISSSKTKPGDQLDIDLSEEMQRKLKSASGSIGVTANRAQSPRPMAELRTKCIPAAPVTMKASRIYEHPKSQSATTVIASSLYESTIGRLKRWFKRRVRDARKAPRELSPPLTAHFWTGGDQQAHAIRDISSSGLYVVTKERWYLGTTVRVVLMKTDQSDLESERSICVHSRAVRWGNDGVGLQFVLKGSSKTRPGETTLADGADRRELDFFLHQLRNSEQRRQIPVLAALNQTEDRILASEKSTDGHHLPTLIP